MPAVLRVQRFVSINGLMGSSLLDVVEEVVLTFRCDRDSSIVCFQRRIDRVGTYLANPNGEYALFERIISPEGRVLSVLPSCDVEKLGITGKGEGDKYVCLEMSVEANRLNTVVFRLRKPITINPVTTRVSKISSIIDKITPYFDAAFSDQITSINAINEQDQYIQVLLNNEHLRIKNPDTQSELENLFSRVRMGHPHMYLAGNKGFAYSFRISASSKFAINYYLTLSDFYKYILWIMMLSILGIIALSILMAINFIKPDLTLPIVTTLTLVLISGYVTIPKESVIKYDEINTLTIIAVIALVISILIVPH